MYVFTPLNQILFTKWLVVKSASLDSSIDNKKASKTPEAIKRNRVKLVNESQPGVVVLFKRLDELILKPIFIRSYETRYVLQK